jgi:thymidylate synthase
LRKHFHFDQLEAAYDALRSNPEGRQVVLQIWDPASDFPDQSGRPVANDIPCNVCAILKVRENRLEWLQVTRSNDLFLGVPYNFVQFTSLQEILAGWLNIDVGSYNQVSDSLHVYETDLLNLSSHGLSLSPANNDSISIPKTLSDRVFSELDSRITILASPDSTEKGLWRTAIETDLPAGHQNMLLVVAADAARRKGWLPVSERLMARCTNPTLIKAWEGWLDRSLQSKQPVPM